MKKRNIVRVKLVRMSLFGRSLTTAATIQRTMFVPLKKEFKFKTCTLTTQHHSSDMFMNFFEVYENLDFSLN